jgi:metal-responsive CopG/Arc/MetJ family transcriptional regulator
MGKSDREEDLVRLFWAKIMISIPEEMVADLNQAAKEEHRSRSEFVREAVRDCIFK